jgi:hypothetical protein
MILLVPQGVVAGIFSMVAPDIRSWFIALYLPRAMQIPASVSLAILDGLALAAAWRLRRTGSSGRS